MLAAIPAARAEHARGFGGLAPGGERLGLAGLGLGFTSRVASGRFVQSLRVHVHVSTIWQLHQSSLAFVRARSDALVKVWGLCSSVSVQSDFAAPLVTYRLHPSQARHSFDGAREQHCSCLFARLTRFRMSG